MSISVKSTKAELLAHIRVQDTQLQQAARSLAEMRTRISVLEGTRALGLKPQPQGIVTLRGVPHHVFTERHGARVTKRFVPIA